MSLLKAAKNEQSALKVGIFGEPGSGKTATGGLLALGISLTLHKGAPVAIHDTENGSDYLVPIFKAEGVDLLVHKSRAFKDMLAVLEEAEGAKCAVWMVDSVTHTWDDLVQSYCAAKKIRKPEFHHWNEIKSMWRPFTDRYLNSPVHCIVSGRAGYQWEYQQNEETGKKELIKGGSKMRVEGQFGYEPSLVIEMAAIRQDTVNGKGGRFLHRASVLKDRTWALNGQSVDFDDRSAYQKGGWKKVYNAFASHINFLDTSVTHHALDQGDSKSIFGDDGLSDHYRRRQEKEILLEEIETTLGTVLFPGRDEKAKRAKVFVVESLFGVRAWKAVEAKPLQEIERGVAILRQFEHLVKQSQPETEEELQGILGNARYAAEMVGRNADGTRVIPAVDVKTEDVPF